MSNSINLKSKKALAWSSITEIAAKLVTPIVNIVLARLLTPEAFGAVATITMVITFAEIFTDAGFQKYIVQHEFDSDEELDKSTNVAFWTNFTVSALLTTLIVIFRHSIADLVGSSGLGNAIAVASLAIIMVAFSSIQMARFKRDLDFKSLFFVRIGASVIPLVVTVPLAFILRNFWALVIGTLCVNIFNAVLLTVKSRWKPRLYYSFYRFKQMFSFTAWTLFESLLTWMSANIDIFIVGSVLSDYYLGLYKTSMTTVNSYMSIISAAIVPVLFSTLSRYQNDDKLFKETYWKFFKFSSLLILPMSMGAFVFNDFITVVLLGSQWMEATDFIGLWGLMNGVPILFSFYASEVYRSKGNPKLSMISQMISLVFLIPIVIIFVNYDFAVLYTARSLHRIVGIVTSILFLCLIYKFKFSDMIKNIIPATVASLIMGVVGVALSAINPAIWWQLISIFMCIAVYFASLLLIFPKLRKELLSISYVGKVLRKFKLKSSSD